MREDLLTFIWRNRHFQQQGLETEDGRPVTVLSPGESHSDQGPDFSHSRIRIGDVVYEGPVELHVRTSDWVRHGHDGDPHYRAVILHVVWTNDLPEAPGDIPVLALEARVSKLLLSRYESWMSRKGFIPCERQLPSVETTVRAGWLGELGRQRLERRAAGVRARLAENRQDWEETTWWMMARSMGLPVNAEVLEAVARSLPLRLLRRHRSHRQTLEALLLGQAGLLEEEGDRAREYRFYRVKYGLTPVAHPVSFLRMRPRHSPGRRLVQLAALLPMGWFAFIREAGTAEEALRAMAGITGLGEEMRRAIVINAFVPLLFAYGQTEKARHWLEQLPAERNSLLARWAGLGMTAGNAAGSQALLQLAKEYCDARRCLECSIGRACLAA
jgi:hypothetical protein